MSKHGAPNWRRLDNAAKIFPPNSNKRDTKVFRFSCTLNEEVNEESLQLGLDKTMESFPLYASIIRKGLFWYYFEASSIKPTVKPEKQSPCRRLYNDNNKGLLFQITYYKSRINLEIYHALTDGVGALQFLRTLVLNYLLLTHKSEFDGKNISLDYDASRIEQEMDDFKTNYSKGKRAKTVKVGKAYRIKGEKLDQDFLRVIIGRVSVKEVLAQAHNYHTTLTIFLTAVMIYAIGKDMTGRDRKRPIVVSVPVNLRPYFKSASARNFFSVLHVPYYFEEETSLEGIINYLQEYFRKELNAEKFKGKINHLVALEHNYFTRAVPLILKRPTLKIAHYLANKEVTTSFSNIGKVTMPSEIESYIDTFDVYVSTSRVQVCLCSYGDKLSISFTSPLVSTQIQKHFFRELTSRGIQVTLTTNLNSETV